MASGLDTERHLAKFVVGYAFDIEVYVFSNSVLIDYRSNVTRRLAIGRQALSELVHAGHCWGQHQRRSESVPAATCYLL